jgi:hypothetical protein
VANGRKDREKVVLLRLLLNPAAPLGDRVDDVISESPTKEIEHHWRRHVECSEMLNDSTGLMCEPDTLGPTRRFAHVVNYSDPKLGHVSYANPRLGSVVMLSWRLEGEGNYGSCS